MHSEPFLEPQETPIAESVDTKLENAVAVASAGIALLKMLETLLPDAGQDVQQKSQDLTAHFLTLTHATGIQGTLLARLLQGNGTVSVGGEDVPYDSFVSLLAFRLLMALRQNLACSRGAQAALADTENSLQRLRVLKNEAKRLLPKGSDSAALCERIQSAVRAVENDLTSMRSKLSDMVLDATDENTCIQDSETMEQLAKNVPQAHTRMNEIKEESATTAKTIADITSDVVTHMQFEDRHSQVMEDVTGILTRYRSMLESMCENLAPLCNEPLSDENVFQAIEVIASGIRLSEIRNLCRRAPWHPAG